MLINTVKSHVFILFYKGYTWEYAPQVFLSKPKTCSAFSSHNTLEFQMLYAPLLRASIVFMLASHLSAFAPKNKHRITAQGLGHATAVCIPLNLRRDAQHTHFVVSHISRPINIPQSGLTRHASFQQGIKNMPDENEGLSRQIIGQMGRRKENWWPSDMLRFIYLNGSLCEWRTVFMFF